MVKNILFIFFFLLLSYHSISQSPLVKQWDFRFGGSAVENLTSLQQTTDGGYMLGGISYSGVSGDKTQPSQGQHDYWLVKTDSLGLLQWERRFGGSQGDWLQSVQPTSDGGYILGGFSNSGISGDKTQPNVGFHDYWIVKIDSLGAFQWDKTIGGTGNDALYAIHQTDDGGFLLAGFSGSDSSGSKTEPSRDTCVTCVSRADYWIVKTDFLGNLQWDKTFGGLAPDNLHAMDQTADGGFLLAGYSASGIGGDKTKPTKGGADYWIVKTDPLGNFQWDQDFGGTDDDWLFSIQQTTELGFLLGGFTYSDSGGDKTQPLWDTCIACIYRSDYWIVNIDSVGIKQWDRAYGGFNLEIDFEKITQTSDGGFLFGGLSYSPASGNKTENNLGMSQSWVVKTDALGIVQWDKTVFTTGHDDQGLAIQTSDGCYAIANYTDGGIGGDKSQPSQGFYDYWIIKYCDSTAISALFETDLMGTVSLNVFPNPFSTQSKITFSNPLNEKFIISVYDYTGAVCSKLVTTEGELVISKNNMATGMYLIELINEKTGNRMHGKLLVSD